MISTRIQEQEVARKPFNWIETLILRLHAWALKLYPAVFRAAFADEMLDVFAMSLREADGRFALVLVLLHELLSFPLSLIVTYRQTYNQLSPRMQQRQNVRWFVRIIGCLLSLFLLSTLRVIVSPAYNLYAQAVPFVIALFVASLSLLLGIRWGRIGGLLTIASGAAIGCCMTLYVYVMALDEVGLVATLLIGFVWALPFLIFGILFYELSKQPKPQLVPT